ncbi:MAG: sulfatase-like hydrolase/transferase [Desulfosudaceae bacterium]
MDRRKFLKIMAGGVVAASGAAACLTACSRQSQKPPRLVLLYAPCTVNKNCLSPFNEEVGYTPHIRDFAARAAVFHNCQTESGQTGIAYAGLFSGCQADRHGIFNHPDRLDDSVYQIFEAFAENGYDVFFWGGHAMADFQLNYGQGTHPDQAFDYPLFASDIKFLNVLKRLESDPAYRVLIVTGFTVTHFPYYPVLPPYPTHLPSPDIPVRKKFYDIKKIPDTSGQLRISARDFKKYYQVYLRHYLNLMYDLDNTVEGLGFSAKEKKDLIAVIEYTYKVNIARLDRLFGDIVNRIKQHNLFNDSLIVFTADHGETLYRKNAMFHFTHGGVLDPEVIPIPLLISAPGAGVKPGHHQEVMSSIDIFPTLAGLCGLELSEKPDGLDFSREIRSGSPLPQQPVYSHTALLASFVEVFDFRTIALGTIMGSPDRTPFVHKLRKLYPEDNPEMMWVAVRHGSRVYKIIKRDINNPRFEPAVFDLSVDPLEERNIFDRTDQEHVNILAELKAYKDKLIRACNKKTSETDPDSPDHREKLRRLRSLGYL